MCGKENGKFGKRNILLSISSYYACMPVRRYERRLKGKASVILNFCILSRSNRLQPTHTQIKYTLHTRSMRRTRFHAVPTLLR